MITDRFRLDDRVVVITGASSGLGVAFARACKEAGAEIVLAARRGERLAQVVADLGGGVTVVADVSQREDCRRIVATTVERFGRIDVLVNNAGTTDPMPASRLDEATYEHVLATNLAGPLWLAQAAAPAMPPGSTIINVASVIALTAVDLPSTAYAASKAGLVGLSRTLARQWSGRKGIRVNTLLPGWFPSELTADGQADNEPERIVLGRVGDPAELAAALVFLASPASSYMTGAELVVDGGFTLT